MNFTPTTADIEVIENGAAMIDGDALALRLAHTKGAPWTDWAGEETTKVVYDDMVGTVKGLYALADRMRQGSLPL